jgi:OmcA/MtrC family decaheme c-type cytochrome
MMRTIVRGGLIALLTSVLAACGGGGSDGVNGAPGAPGPTASVTNPGIQVTSLTPDQWTNLQMQGQILGVDLSAGTPKVTFRLTDLNGNAIVGMDQMYAQAAGAKLPTQKNVFGVIAKLVPGSNGGPSNWVAYTVESFNATTGAIGYRAPNTDSNGTLKYLGDGEYQYTFATDITQVKANVDANAASPGDLGDLTYDPGLPYRVVIQISGAARGTSTNTPDGSNSGIAAANLANPLNLVYDSSSPQRDIVKINSCNNCHSKLAFHGGGRVDTRYCVVCHTNQRKYAATNHQASVLGTTTITYDDGSTKVVPSWNPEPLKYPNGNALRDFPIMVHSIHRGEELPVYLNASYINDVAFPQPITNCFNCHTGNANGLNGANATPQGDNYKNNPSRKACGACHNDVDFATGANHPAPGGARADDSACKTCHTPDAIANVYHVSVDPTGSVDRGGYPANTAQDVPTPGWPAGQGPAIPLASATHPPAGVHTFKYEIASATIAANKATVKYRILMDGTPATFLPAGNPYLLPNLDGTPSIYVTYGQIQEGVAAAVDWTGNINTTVLNCRNQAASCTQTGPDANGYYTATLSSALPADAKLITAELGINYQDFVQLDAPGYAAIRTREPAFAILTAGSQTARRPIVEAARCNKCHNQLGVAPSFHSGARNNPQGCATGSSCHFEGRASSGGWSISAKGLIHGIHGGSQREQPFSYQATAQNLKGYGTIGYPGVLNNCEQCHVPGSYDFSGSANASAQPNLLWTHDATGNMTSASSIGLSPWIAKLGKGPYDYSKDNLVSSPIASACFGCHDSDTAITHMQQNGGRLLQLVSAVTGGAPNDTSHLNDFNNETCLVCHGSGKVADIKVVHNVTGVTLP